MDIKLTDVERLILANQYEILAKLNENNLSGEYTEIANNLLAGHEFFYANSIQDILSDNIGVAKSRYVFSVLHLHAILKASYEKLEDKSGIEPAYISFIGFDSKSEAGLLSFVKALYRREIYMSILETEDMDACTPTSGVYLRMLDEWANLGKPDFPLSKEDIIAIANAHAQVT